jgi:hypothetical protein
LCRVDMSILEQQTSQHVIFKIYCMFVTSSWTLGCRNLQYERWKYTVSYGRTYAVI